MQYHAQYITVYQFYIKIFGGFTWALHFQSKKLDAASCPVLSPAQDELKTPHDVLNLMQLLSNCKICSGNPDEKFFVLLNEHEGVFKDIHGKYIFYAECMHHIFTA